MDDDYEQVLLVKPDVFIYKIPPRTSISRAHRAADWKLDQPDWKGRLRLIVKGKKCIIKLEDKENGKLFAESFVETFPGSDIESVSDSSRYFVIKIKDSNSGRTAFIGIGFEDRSDSFDLNVALQDHFKREAHALDEANKDEDNTPKIDLSLKEGQTIKVNLNFGKKSTTRPKPKSNSSNPIGLLLPPPPSQNSNTSDSKQLNDILSFDSPKRSKNPLDEFDNLKLNNSNKLNDDWSCFESYKPSNDDSSKKDNSDQSNNWATFS